MRQTLSRGMVAAAAATGILSLCGNPVYADSGAGSAASGSPGVASGNTVQVPVDAPVNLCGNTVDVVAVLNPAFGNACANGSGAGSSTVPAQTPRATGPGDDHDRPGNGNGNDHGNGVSRPGRPEGGQQSRPSGNSSTPPRTAPGRRPDAPQAATPPRTVGTTPSRMAPTLAETGSEGLIAASAVSVAMLAGGLILYRRSRATARR
ncbi:chaplin family protein [Streptomyces sp. NPDC007264]|uniref:chaplin family protein n=1 Tax=Streptomyces sp. NPDC007264 TaxID=3364777 RepID=UPI0036DF71C2